MFSRALKLLAVGSAAVLYAFHKQRAFQEEQEEDWRAYHEGTRTKIGASPAVIAALEKEPDAHVCDIGAGTGATAIDIARKFPNSRVTATNVDKTALQILAERLEKEGLETRVRSLRHDIARLPLPLPLDSHSIVIARDVLPFVNGESLGAIVRQHIQPTMTSTGCLHVTFFGPEHAWCADKGVTCHTPQEVLAVLSSFQTCFLTRKVHTTKTATKGDVTWDEIAVVACGKK